MTRSTPVGIEGIGQIYVPVHDLERATAFYRDRLGLQHLFTAGTMSFFDCGDVRLMLGTPEKPEFDHPSSILYFRVTDVAAAHAALAADVEFVQEPLVVHRTEEHELWMAFFKDTEGNTMALMAEMPVAGL